jgi:predicted amidohydrolase YtcJ
VTNADFVLLEGNIHTMNPKMPTAQAIAVKGNRISFVGTNKEVAGYIGEKTKVIRLEGKTVLPGFIDTHIHVADYGRLLTWLNLETAGSIKDIQAQLSQRIKQSGKGKWVLGRALNPDGLAEKRLPTRQDLDAVAPENPVVFYCQQGQVCIANSMALEAAKISQQTDTGIEKTPDNKPTGILRDDATNLVWNVIPEPTEQELYDATKFALEKIVEAGITSIHWIMLSEAELPVIKKLAKSKEFALRVYLIVPANLLDSALQLKQFEDERFRLGGAFIFSDGYLASRTAALKTPYSDSPNEQGKMLHSKAEMAVLAEKIQAAGLQLIIHAVGDKAVKEALDVIEENRKNALTPPRLEQAAVLNPQLVQRIKELGVSVSVQPCVVASEFSVWSAESHLGKKRAGWLFPVKELLRQEVLVAAGSDCPMEPLNPLLGVEAAINRADGQKVTISEALEMYTVLAAKASSEGADKGSIEQGKLADLTVLSKDPLSLAGDKMDKITICLTTLDGVIECSKN